MSAHTSVLTPEEIAARQIADAPYVRLPNAASHFAERELRLRQLAAGHAMRDYLLFLAALVHEQQQSLNEHPSVPLPDAAALARAGGSGVAPLPALQWPLDAGWRHSLRAMAQRLLQQPGLAATAGVAAMLKLVGTQASDDWLDQQAHRILAGSTLGLDMASAPLLAAALQVHFTHLVVQTQRLFGSLRGQATGVHSAFGRTDDTAACPCCASRPVASITRPEGGVNGQRYLACSLCGTQWHRSRIQCSRCASQKVNFQALEANPGHSQLATGVREGALQAECCEDCGHYLKIMHMEKDVHVEPAADDLASLTLDLLVGESGLARHGVNLMMLMGDDGGDAGGTHAAAPTQPAPSGGS